MHFIMPSANFSHKALTAVIADTEVLKQSLILESFFKQLSQNHRIF